jgi:hypothetical protein
VEDTHLLGATASFQVNDNLTLFVSHMQSTSSDADPLTLEGALSRLTLTWGWHPVIEQRRSFNGD